MPDWIIDEHKTAGGQSYFADFVAGLTDAKDIKDAAVLTGALRPLGNQLREPRSKSLENGQLSYAALGCGYITDSYRVGALYWSGDRSRNAPILRQRCSN